MAVTKIKMRVACMDCELLHRRKIQCGKDGFLPARRFPNPQTEIARNVILYEWNKHYLETGHRVIIWMSVGEHPK